MKVLGYNVRSLRDDRAVLAGIVRRLDPDVACLQEVPRFLFWRRTLRRLARECGMEVAAGGRPAAANAVLVRPGLPVVRAGSAKLPWHPPKHRRGLAYAVVETGGRRVAVASTHLSLDPAERQDQARRILQLLSRLDHPVVLAGDLNDDEAGPAWRTFAALLTDAWAAAPDGPGATFPARRPRRRIDGVFVDRRLGVERAGVPDLPGIPDASDHCPVLAVVTVG